MPLLPAEFEAAVRQPTRLQAAWRRVGCLPSSDARSRIANIPKPGAEVNGGAGTSRTPSEPEQLHLHFLRALLGLPACMQLATSW